jgi:hypothetical protein
MAFSGVARDRATLLPLAPERYERFWMSKLLDRLSALILERLSTREAAPHVLLLSPSAKVFRVTVDDTGSLTVTEMLQGDPTA